MGLKVAMAPMKMLVQEILTIFAPAEVMGEATVSIKAEKALDFIAVEDGEAEVVITSTGYSVQHQLRVLALSLAIKPI